MWSCDFSGVRDRQAILTPQNLFAKSWSCTLAVRVLSVCFDSVSLSHFAITFHPLMTLSPSPQAICWLAFYGAIDRDPSENVEKTDFK